MKNSNWLNSLAQQWGRGLEEQEAVWRWREAVGDALSKLARPLYVDRGTLHIAVATPVVANELRLWSREILARLANVAPRSCVREFRFHLVAEQKGVGGSKVTVSSKELDQAEKMVPRNLPSSLRENFVKLLAQVLAQESAILAQGGRRCKKCNVVFLGRGEECPLCRLAP